MDPVSGFTLANRGGETQEPPLNHMQNINNGSETGKENFVCFRVKATQGSVHSISLDPVWGKKKQPNATTAARYIVKNPTITTCTTRVGGPDREQSREPD